jgi:hypothetical protein
MVRLILYPALNDLHQGETYTRKTTKFFLPFSLYGVYSMSSQVSRAQWTGIYRSLKMESSNLPFLHISIAINIQIPNQYQ